MQGKGVLDECEAPGLAVAYPAAPLIELKWEPPHVGWIKLNTNGPYLPSEGSAATDRVLRDSSGAIIFTTCRNLIKCDNALELELSAISQGVSLALQWSNLLINVESGCLDS